MSSRGWKHNVGENMSTLYLVVRLNASTPSFTFDPTFPALAGVMLRFVSVLPFLVFSVSVIFITHTFPSIFTYLESTCNRDRASMKVLVSHKTQDTSSNTNNARHTTQVPILYTHETRHNREDRRHNTQHKTQNTQDTGPMTQHTKHHKTQDL